MAQVLQQGMSVVWGSEDQAEWTAPCCHCCYNCPKSFTWLTVSLTVSKFLLGTLDSSVTVDINTKWLGMKIHRSIDSTINYSLWDILKSYIAKRTTRNSQMLQIPLCRTVTGQRSFHYRTIKLWNSLDPVLKLKSTLRDFKLSLEEKLISKFLETWMY